jgi:hypothetical protein
MAQMRESDALGVKYTSGCKWPTSSSQRCGMVRVQESSVDMGKKKSGGGEFTFLQIRYVPTQQSHTYRTVQLLEAGEINGGERYAISHVIRRYGGGWEVQHRAGRREVRSLRQPGGRGKGPKNGFDRFKFHRSHIPLVPFFSTRAST